MSSAEVASLGRVSGSYVRQLARNGKLGAIRDEAGGKQAWSFDQAAVEEWARLRSTPAVVTVADDWERDLLIAEANDARHSLVVGELEHRIREQAVVIEQQSEEIKRWKALAQGLSATVSSIVESDRHD